jgi:hypothetical protein
MIVQTETFEKPGNFHHPQKKMDFFEVTGGLRPDPVLEGIPSRKGGPTPRGELKKSPSS